MTFFKNLSDFRSPISPSRSGPLDLDFGYDGGVDPLYVLRDRRRDPSASSGGFGGLPYFATPVSFLLIGNRRKKSGIHRVWGRSEIVYQGISSCRIHIRRPFRAADHDGQDSRFRAQLTVPYRRGPRFQTRRTDPRLPPERSPPRDLRIRVSLTLPPRLLHTEAMVEGETG